MIRIRQVKIPIDLDNKEYIKKKISKKLNIKEQEIIDYKIIKKSIDARDKNNILYSYEFDINIENENKVLKYIDNKDIYIKEEEKYQFKNEGTIKLKERPIIIGSGPAGLFCAYMLSKIGMKPIVIERGEKVEERIKTVEHFFKTNELNPNSNIQFGEGGAGTFSDGKLNTLTKDKQQRGKKVLEIFVENGAPEEILYINNPHIGTDILRKVIVNLRNKIISLGGEFKYNTTLTNLVIENNKLVGVEINNKEILKTNILVLAIGHSARDTFYMLNENNILMQPKNFAMGLRIEHPRKLIDENQYGKNSKLQSASYKLTYQTTKGRSVYSFCMCPGGFVVNASSEKERLCINGMSNYKRDEKNSNSAIVVNIVKEDYNNELF